MKIKLMFPHYRRAIIGGLSLLFSASVIALSCPGPKDFVSISASFWGWSWELRPGIVDFIAPQFTWMFYSPYGDRNNFSADYPLVTGLLVKEGPSSVRSEASLSCKYTLEGGEYMFVSSRDQLITKDELTRIKNSWNHTYQRSDSTHTVERYVCSSTAGTADVCSIDLQPTYPA